MSGRSDPDKYFSLEEIEKYKFEINSLKVFDIEQQIDDMNKAVSIIKEKTEKEYCLWWLF